MGVLTIDGSYLEDLVCESKSLARQVGGMNRDAGLDQEVLILEECSEVIKEITKQLRGQKEEGNADLIEELCDIFASSYVYLLQHNFCFEDVLSKMNAKYQRALDRYEATGQI